MPHRTIRDAARLHALIDAMLLVEEESSLDELLQRVVDVAADLVGVRYAALGVLDSHRTSLRAFLTHGVTPEERERIGALPTGKGLLGRVIDEPETLCLEDLSASPFSSGFPPNHPPMRQFLGVPVRLRDGAVFGNLYLCDRLDGEPFTPEDAAVVEALGRSAGLAIAEARLREQLHEVTLAEERTRLARDLHDTVIQRLFAVGLSLQPIAGEELTEAARRRLDDAIDELDATIRDIRTTIFEIRERRGDDASLRHELRSIVDEATSRLGLRVSVEFVGPLDAMVGPIAAGHVVHVVRELISNVVRHAQATRATLTVAVENGRLEVVVADDGIGPRAWAQGGNGLENVRCRAAALGGTAEIAAREGGGTVVTFTARSYDE